MSKSLITPLALISYPHIATKGKPNEEGKEGKYGCTLIFIPEILAIPSEKALFDAMQQALLAAGKEKFGTQFEALLKSETFRKGVRRDAESKNYPAGSIFINVRADKQPICVFPYADPSTGKPARIPQEKIQETFYPGAVVRASVSPFAYNSNGNRGLSFGLNNLQFVKDGERLDGRTAAEDEFAVIDLSASPASLEDLI